MKRIYQKPCAIRYDIVPSNMLASSPVLDVVDDESKTVNTEVDLWGNKRQQGNPIWDNEL